MKNKERILIEEEKLREKQIIDVTEKLVPKYSLDYYKENLGAKLKKGMTKKPLGNIPLWILNGDDFELQNCDVWVYPRDFEIKEEIEITRTEEEA